MRLACVLWGLKPRLGAGPSVSNLLSSPKYLKHFTLFFQNGGPWLCPVRALWCMAAVGRSAGVTAQGTRPRMTAGKGSRGKRGLWLPDTWPLYGKRLGTGWGCLVLPLGWRERCSLNCQSCWGLPGPEGGTRNCCAFLRQAGGESCSGCKILPCAVWVQSGWVGKRKGICSWWRNAFCSFWKKTQTTQWREH